MEDNIHAEHTNAKKHHEISHDASLLRSYELPLSLIVLCYFLCESADIPIVVC